MGGGTEPIYVTRKEFYLGLSIVWLYIMLVVGDLMRLEARWSTRILWLGSCLLLIVYLVAGTRAGRKAAGKESLMLSDRVKEIARDPARKIEAIKLYREETGAGLLQSKEAVEAFIESL